MTVGGDYPRQQERLRELIQEYRGLPNGAGFLGASLIEQVLKRADVAALGGDLVAILKSYEEMKGCE